MVAQLDTSTNCAVNCAKACPHDKHHANCRYLRRRRKNTTEILHIQP